MRDSVFKAVSRQHGVHPPVRQAFPEVCLEPVLGPFARALRARFCALFGSWLRAARHFLRAEGQLSPSAGFSHPSVNKHGLLWVIWDDHSPTGRDCQTGCLNRASLFGLSRSGVLIESARITPSCNDAVGLPKPRPHPTPLVSCRAWPPCHAAWAMWFAKFTRVPKSLSATLGVP